jgi:hypothetical protein
LSDQIGSDMQHCADHAIFQASAKKTAPPWKKCPLRWKR